MAKKKDKKQEDIIMRFDPPKPKINEKKIKAMEELLKDEGCKYLGREEMQNIVNAYKAGRKGK
jgi:hypothetical protein